MVACTFGPALRRVFSLSLSATLVLTLAMLFGSATLTAPAHAGLAFTGSLGAQTYPDFSEPSFGYTIGVYNKFDDQVWIGVQSGQGVAGEASAIPILAAAYVRLPLGRIIMPVATGGLGYTLGDERKGLTWRAGGLFDIRNGRRSSLLLGVEYEGIRSSASDKSNRGGLIGRAGLLLEF